MKNVFYVYTRMPAILFKKVILFVPSKQNYNNLLDLYVF